VPKYLPDVEVKTIPERAGCSQVVE